MFEPLIWLLLIEVIGLAALPLAFSVFRFLPERGYTLAKPLGLLLTAYLVWLLSMLGLPFSALTSWLVFGVGFVALNGWLLWRQAGRLRIEIGGFFARNVWLIVLCELIFVVAYAYLVWLRTYMPDIRDQEKFGDFAFLNSLSIFDKMPPADPWMSGYPINYYYFSHFMMAMLVKMTGISPAIAFNLTVPLVFALTALASFGLVYNLVSLAKGRKQKLEIRNQKSEISQPENSASSSLIPHPSSLPTSPSVLSPQSSVLSPSTVAILVGLLGLVMVCLLGNLDATRQVLFPRLDKGESGLDGANGFYFNWWGPSRVIWDYMPIPSGAGVIYRWTETINEFPMFSFLLADMHPHVMTLPTALLAIGLALNILVTPVGLARSDHRMIFVVTAIAVGALYFLNTWDYPTYLLLIVLAALLRERQLGRLEVRKEPGVDNRWLTLGKLALLGGALPHPQQASLLLSQFVRWGGYAVRLTVVSLALYLPFHLTFVSLVGDNNVPEPIGSFPILGTLGKLISFVAWDRSPLLGYFLVFGVFIFPLLSLLVLKLWPYVMRPYGYLDEDSELPESKLQVPSGWGYYITACGIFLVLLSEIGFFILNLNPVATLVLGLMAAPITAIGAGMLAAELLEKYRADRPETELLALTGALAALMITGGWIVRFELYGPLLICAVGAGLLLWFESRPEQEIKNQELEISQTRATASSSSLIPQPSSLLSDRFVLLLAFLPVVITFGTELILVRDVFNSRLNTLFKFYYQAWVMFGLAAAYASWRILAWMFTGISRQPTVINAASNRQPASLETEPELELVGVAASSSSSQPPITPGDYTSQLSTSAYDFNDDPEAEAAEEYQMAQPRRPWWRWVWALALGLLLIGGMVYPIFGPYEKTGRFARLTDQAGQPARSISLDGSLWLRDGGPTGGPLPGDYQAIQWLKEQLAANKNFAGTILEASGSDWVDFSRVSAFTGLPTVMGWPGHENQWRGGKAFARSDALDCGQTLVKYGVRQPLPGVTRSLQKDEPYCRLYMVELIYSTDNAKLAEQLLREAGVRYVYVGSLETGASNGRSSETKSYAPQSLLKFSQFMKVIYERNGVTIYSF